MNNDLNVDVRTLRPFTRFIYTIGELPSSYLMSMTYQEQLTWFCNYLATTVIPTVNNNGLAVEELQQKYIELKNYVDTYFENLDVQEEINNKIDEMVLDGTLTNIIKDYIDPLFEIYKGSVNEEITNFENGVNSTLQSQNTRINNIESDVNSNIEIINNKVNSITSGAPKGVYATVNDLETADPDHDYIYLVTADGKWYYYDSTNEEWAEGGVYQSTGIADNSIQYNNLTKLLQEKVYKEIKAEDIFWIDHASMVSGQFAVISDIPTYTSIPFILPKGNTITIDPSLKSRITVFDLNFAYVSNTGGYSTKTNWSYSGNTDCIIYISLQSNTETPMSTSDITNTNIVFTGLSLENKYGKSLKFHIAPDSNNIAISDPFYLPAGAKIGFNSNKRSSLGGNDYYNMFYFLILEEGTEFSIYNVNNYTKTNLYTTTQSGMVKMYIRWRMSNTPINNYLDLINQDITIEGNYYIPNNSLLFPYIDNNASIDIKKSGGNLLVRFNDYVNIMRNTERLYRFNMDTLETNFSDLITTVDDVKYFTLQNTRILYYDICDNELKINTMEAPSILYGENCIPLLINRAANLCGGILMPLYLKNRVNSLQTQVDNIDYTNLKNTLDMFNSKPYGTYDWETLCKNFSKLYNNKSKNINSFLFFTDPHLMGSDDIFSENRLINYLNPLEKIYNSLPLQYIICGGDWLNDGDIQDVACFKLGYIDGFMKSKFKNYYPIIGNHDTNYQGKLDSEASANTGILTNDTQINLMFKRFNSKYYSFNTENSINYVLDSELDWVNTMNEYKWTQIDWLANKLINDDPEHSTVFIHMLWVTQDHTLGAMTQPLTQLIQAFNNKSVVTLNSITYDFTGCTGHVDYVLSGHTHADYNETINGVLCVATMNFFAGTGTYDICINDYDNHKLIMHRIGSGDSREFNI